MPERIDIPWPFGGISEDLAFDDQEPLTTRSALNVRNLDPKTGRTRGAKRPGRKKHNSTQIDASRKIGDILGVTYSQKTVTYALSASSDWTANTESGGDCPWGEVDAFNNSYVINDGEGVSKYSDDGQLVYTYPLDAGEYVGVLDVDEGENVYVGVTGTRGNAVTEEPGNGFIIGDIEKACLWKLRHGFRDNDEELEPELEEAWKLTYDPDEGVGPNLYGLIGFVKAKKGRLYTIQHDNNAQRSWVVVYDQIHTGVPVESLVREWGYPATGLDVDDQGRIAVCGEENTRRGENPESPQTTMALKGWDYLTDIDEDNVTGDKKHQIWAAYRVEPQYLVSTSGAGVEPDDGATILQWSDASGNGRHLYFDADGGKKGPTYRRKGLAGKPCIVFNGSDQLLTSSLSPSSTPDFRDNQRGIFPNYSDPDFSAGSSERSAQYAVVALIRPEATDDGTTAVSNQFPAWSHATKTYSSDVDANQVALCLNRQSGGTAGEDLSSTTNTSARSISLYTSADGTGEGGTNNDVPAWKDGAATADKAASFNNSGNALLVSYINCNGLDAGQDDDKTRSLLRIWGAPIDRWAQEADTLGSTAKQYLGGSGDSDFSSFGLFSGEMYELVVLDRKQIENTGSGNDVVVTHPPDPDRSTGGNCITSVRITAQGSGGTPTSDNGALAFSGGNPTSAATGTWNSVDGKITTITMTDPGEGYDGTAVTVTATGYNGSGATLAANYGFDDSNPPASPTILEKIEGSIAWEFGLSHLFLTLPDDSPGTYRVKRTNSSGTEGNYVWFGSHPYSNSVDTDSEAAFRPGAGPPVNSKNTDLGRMAHKSEYLGLMNSNGDLLDISSHTHNGIGFGVQFHPDGNSVYTVGNSAGLDGYGTSTAANGATARRIGITDDAFDYAHADSWAVLDDAPEMQGRRVGIKVDKTGNLYVPCNAPTDTADAFVLKVLKHDDGSALVTYTIGSGTTEQPSFCVAIPRELDGLDLIASNPDYETDLTTHVAEDVWIFGAALAYDGSTARSAIQKYNLVTTTPNGNQPRLQDRIAIANGTLYRFDSGSTVVTLTGNTLYAPGANEGYYHSVLAFEKGYFSDGGDDYTVYDPKSSRTTVSVWEADKGEIPKRCRILELWRGRVVLTAQESAPSAVHMSRVSKPNDWDKAPPVPTTVQACEFSLTDVGEQGDRVNAFIPYTHDFAVIGGDHSIRVLRGDPMRGGQMDLITDTTGIAFGRAWCIDSEGRIYFFGSRGGIYRMQNALTIPQRLSLRRIERRLQNINLATHFVRMVYDAEREGVWIMVIPFADPSAVLSTYYFEIKQDAFWEDQINAASGTVTAIAVVDGDAPDDRLILTGHGDGFIREVDDDTVDDDATAVECNVTIGPIKAANGQEIRCTRLGLVTDDDQGSVNWEGYATDTPNDIGSSLVTGDFSGGNSLTDPCRMRGSHLFIRLTQNASGSRFAYEHGYLDVTPTHSRMRVR